MPIPKVDIQPKIQSKQKKRRATALRYRQQSNICTNSMQQMYRVQKKNKQRMANKTTRRYKTQHKREIHNTNVQ